MYNEIDSSNIIAALASNKSIAEKNELIISYLCIRKIAEDLEDRIPTLLATYDMMSIDAFRCYFVNHVVMKENELVINNLKEIYKQLLKLQPSERMTNMIYEISKKIVENEKNT